MQIGEVRVAERADVNEMVGFEEVLRSCLYEQEALRRVLVRKGFVSDQEVLAEIKTARRELEAKRAK